jgi:hypothetical protein
MKLSAVNVAMVERLTSKSGPGATAWVAIFLPLEVSYLTLDGGGEVGAERGPLSPLRPGAPIPVVVRGG